MAKTLDVNVEKNRYEIWENGQKYGKVTEYSEGKNVDRRMVKKLSCGSTFSPVGCNDCS